MGRDFSHLSQCSPRRPYARVIARGAHLSAARAHEGPCLLSRGPTENKKDEAPCMVRVSVNLCVVCPRPPGHPTQRGPENFAKNIARRRLRPLLSETATPAILRTFRTSSVTLNQSHPIFRVFFVFIADFSDQTSKKRKNVIYNMLSLL